MLLDSNQFPYMRNSEEDALKHPKRSPTHLKSAIKSSTYIVDGGENKKRFDIGNERLEKLYPHYHILQQAPAIRKRGKSTAKTRGSQAKVENLGQRDYERVNWNGKTFTKEYSKNVRGSRKRITSISHWTEDYAGNNVFVNREANAYQNIHYKYIDNILNTDVVDRIALEFGLKRKRTIKTGLGEEYAMQPESEYTTDIGSILDMFSSHNLGE